MRLILGQQNTYTSVFTPSTGKLIINGLLNYTINLQSPVCLGAIISIYDVTAAKFLPLDSTVSIAKTTSTTTGLQVFTLTWTTLPSGLANDDTLLIEINASYQWVMYSLAQYQKA